MAANEKKAGKGLMPWALLGLGFYFGLAGAPTIGGVLVVAAILIFVG